MTNTSTVLDDMLNAYVECALWSTTDQSTESGGYPLDQNYGADDIAPESLASMREDCVEFAKINRERLNESGLTAEQAGHDFWLTRNHHGTGFWDRGLPNWLGKLLSESAHAYGSSDLYVGDDGKLYVA